MGFWLEENATICVLITSFTIGNLVWMVALLRRAKGEVDSPSRWVVEI